MRISKEKWEALKRRGKHHWNKNKGGYKSTGFAGGAGGAFYFLSKMVGSKVQFLNENWWAMPLAGLAGGHFLAKKNAPAGHGIAGAAGYAAAISYDLKKQAAAVKTGTQGYDDAAALTDQVFDQVSAIEDASALQDASDDYQAAELPEASDAGAFDDAAALQDQMADLG